MTRIVAIGGSSSSISINKKFASYAANLVSLKKNVIELDLRQYEMPIYSEDLQNLSGIPKKAFDFKSEISNSDALVISLAEHNGSYTAAFKNIYDWVSVIEETVWSNKPLILLSTSDGKNAGNIVMQTALSRFSRQSKFEIPHFSLPEFNENFSDKDGITDTTLIDELNKQIKVFNSQVESLLDTSDN